MTDYKTQFNEDTTALIATNIADRTERMAAVQALIDRYVETNGVVPDRAQLERLTDYILREELTDPTSWKTRHIEYPFLSEMQMARRTDGVHQRKYEAGNGETKFSASKNIGTDGRNYNVPRRRERTKTENTFMDEAVKSRNKETRKKYEEFTAVQPVTTYTLTHEEMEERGWR